MTIAKDNNEDGFSFEQWQAYIDGKSHELAAHQDRLRNHSRHKFSQTDNWVWTRKLLEQSSDEWTARLTASYFPTGVLVHDICCGAGADSVALSLRGPVSVVDASAIACLLTERNLQITGGKDYSVKHGSAESFLATSRLSQDDWIHIDPDRRSTGTKTTSAESFSPPLAVVLDLIASAAGGSLKVAPATTIDFSTFSSHTSSTQTHLLETMSRQFISWGNSVRQQRWWWGTPLLPVGSITLSMRRSLQTSMNAWSHWTVASEESNSAPPKDVVAATWSNGPTYIGDTDPCVRAARLQSRLAEKLHCEILGSEQGYFFSQSTELPPNDPFVDWFLVEEVMALDRKRLGSYLKKRSVGVLEIKTRDAPIVPESLRKELRLAGEESRTLLITKYGKKIIVIVAKRMNNFERAMNAY